MSSDTFSVSAIASANPVYTSQQTLTFFSLDVLLSYFRNIAENSAGEASGEYAAKIVSALLHRANRTNARSI
jgi:hypothetical protein